LLEKLTRDWEEAKLFFKNFGFIARLLSFTAFLALGRREVPGNEIPAT